ncbi:MAG: class I SAM-dependent methyltransferase [Nocardioidaceae bacterium]
MSNAAEPVTAAASRTGARYTFDAGAAGKQRLDVLSQVLHPATAALLDTAGVAPGLRCLDVGCGGGHVTCELARRVAPAGHVVGVDLDADVLELAARDAAAAGVANLAFRRGDATAPPGDAYDVVYARFLLSHLTEPAAVTTAMARALAPGGVLITEDIDATASFCAPHSAAFHWWVRLFRDAVHRRGGNPDIGPMLPSLLAGAGLTGIQVSVHQPAGVDGPVKQLVLQDLHRSVNAITTEGLASAAEVDQLIRDFTDYVNDPATVVSCPRIMQTWAYAPG